MAKPKPKKTKQQPSPSSQAKSPCARHKFLKALKTAKRPRRSYVPPPSDIFSTLPREVILEVFACVIDAALEKQQTLTISTLDRQTKSRHLLLATVFNLALISRNTLPLVIDLLDRANGTTRLRQWGHGAKCDAVQRAWVRQKELQVKTWRACLVCRKRHSEKRESRGWEEGFRMDWAVVLDAVGMRVKVGALRAGVLADREGNEGMVERLISDGMDKGVIMVDEDE